MSEKPVVLIISGIDPTDGAGMGRDILTVKENGGHPVSIPSVLTVQNSISFERAELVRFEYVRDSLLCLENEFRFSSIKTGLLPFDEEWLTSFSDLLCRFTVPIVIDPVFKATSDKSGEIIVPDSYISLIKGKNRIITPNLKELNAIYKKIYGTISSEPKMASEIAKDFQCTVLTTFEGIKPVINIATSEYSTEIPLVLYKPELKYHGTGCAFSSAVAIFLAYGNDIESTVKKASEYVLEKIKNSVKFDSHGQYFLD